MSLLGLTVTDRVTGFTGVVTGHVDYITGCSQLLVAPKVREGALVASEWIDLQRVEIDHNIKRITLDNGATPGADRLPPRR